MILGMSVAAFTQFHVIISLIAIFSGIIVVWGMLGARRMPGMTALFLITTVATSVTGFFFPVHHFMPSHGVGIISLIALPIAMYALYGRHLAGAWRWIYVVTSLFALYLNVFVLVVQSFLKVPALKALAPTQTETPFKLAQLLVLLAFAVLIFAAVLRTRTGFTRLAAPPLQPA